MEMKRTAVLAIVATLAMGLSGAAWAQETVGSNGQQVDGFGAGGNIQNSLNPDGPNEGSWWLLGQPHARINNVQGIKNCDVKILDNDCFKSAAKVRNNNSSSY